MKVTTFDCMKRKNCSSLVFLLLIGKGENVAMGSYGQKLKGRVISHGGFEPTARPCGYFHFRYNWRTLANIK